MSWTELMVFHVVVVAVILLLAVGGCSSLPSMKYCDQVTYERNGHEVDVSLHCYTIADPPLLDTIKYVPKP